MSIDGENLDREAMDLWMEAFRRRGSGWLPVLSGSMRPLLAIGDRIRVRVGEPRRLPLGSLIVFQRDGKLIVHRLLAKRAGPHGVTFRERGDRNPRSAWIPERDVLGEAIERERAGRATRLTGFPRRAWGLLRAQCSLWGERLADLLRPPAPDPPPEPPEDQRQ